MKLKITISRKKIILSLILYIKNNNYISLILTTEIYTHFRMYFFYSKKCVKYTFFIF